MVLIFLEFFLNQPNIPLTAWTPRERLAGTDPDKAAATNRLRAELGCASEGRDLKQIEDTVLGWVGNSVRIDLTTGWRQPFTGP